jgi:hypothetical protein
MGIGFGTWGIWRRIYWGRDHQGQKARPIETPCAQFDSDVNSCCLQCS